MTADHGKNGTALHGAEALELYLRRLRRNAAALMAERERLQRALDERAQLLRDLDWERLQQQIRAAAGAAGDGRDGA